MRITMAVTLITFSCLSLKAQQITGHITDLDSNPLSNASISLKKTRDSSIVKLGLSDIQGNFRFWDIDTGSYFITASHIGFLNGHSLSVKVAQQGVVVIKPLSLPRAQNQLQEAVVSKQRPLIEMKADRLVLNIAGNTNAIGQDVLELLRKSPGLSVDKDDNLSMNGKNGVQVFIDGKPSPLNGKDLSGYLKSIQSGGVEAIEIISNPSARYEAAGNAGIVNIRLVKDKTLGTNGSIYAGYNLGVYPKYNLGGSFNQRNAHLNIFGNYSYGDNPSDLSAVMRRTVADTLFDNRSGLKLEQTRHNVKIGMDYFIDKENTLGALVSGFYTRVNSFTNSQTPIIYIPDNTLQKLLQANNRARSQTNNTNFNLNFHHKDKDGHDLTIDLDYGQYKINSDQLQPNHYFDASGNPLYSNDYEMISPSHIDIYSLRSDYEQKFAKGLISFGVKSSYVKTANDFEQYNIVASGKEMDTLRSNDFIYKENINAGYINYSWEKKAWSVQGGLRAENTNLKGLSTGFRSDGSGYTAYDSGFTRHYTDLFPSLSIHYKKDARRQWSLSYSRRIDRPAYQDLNPFEFKLDEYTFQKGNTALRPQYTNSIGLHFLYKQTLNTGLEYSHVSQVFSQLFDTTEVSKAVSTKKNLASQHTISLTTSYRLQSHWYGLFLNGNVFYTLYKANLGPGRAIDVNLYSVRLYAQQTASLGKGWTADLSSLYNSPAIVLSTFKVRSMWSVDAGLSKTVLKGAGTVKASVSDIFKGMTYTASGSFAGQSTVFSSRYESRLFKLFFTYRFGGSQVRAARQHKTGDEDENMRAATGH